MTRPRALPLSAVLTALALTLTACGDGNDTPDADENALNLGILYPQTGSLAYLGPSQLSATEYAIEEINAAGGVLGTDMPAPVQGDEADDEGRANDAANTLIADGSDAIIGAASSGMTQAVHDTVASAGIPQCSGSATAPDLTDIDDGGNFYRTAPSDLLAGPVLAQEILDDGHQNVALIARADDYGSGYLQAVQNELRSNGAQVPVAETYDPDTTNFGSVVESVNGDDVDAVSLISFEEGTQILAALIEAGFDGDQLYVTDGLNDPDLGSTVSGNTDLVNGVTGVAPSADNPEFSQGISDFDSDLEVFQFAPQVFDCVNLVALAAESAGSTDPAEYAPHVDEVSRPEGTECGSFEECRDLLDDGQDIDYQGASGNIDLDDNGDPTAATFEVFHWDDDGHGVREYVDYSGEEN
ncbi:ABC transporter substrate-binding protein [Nocardiopsis xinjiangensis]|uniref:ABC transporter substrate-binding protein n=1 Tax=Nocardiopsis xinjiangensis TaxID=124285 RepID=UPI00036D68DB|nr:ABC transporter substrate-binding protein [Nocardiopsis xinjiangensis]